MYRTIPQLLTDAAIRGSGSIWLRTDAETLTLDDAVGEIGAAAMALRSKGIGRGSLVGLTTRNTPPCLLALLAVTSLGAVAVPMNPAATTAELAGLLEQTNPKLVITDGEPAGGVGSAESVEVSELFGAPAELPTDSATPDDVAVLIPTSGTTGRTKLVMQTHRAYVMAGEGFPYWMQLDAGDRLMTSLPLFHINAQAYSVLGSLVCGAGLVLLPRFSASDFLNAARRHGATEFNAIGAMLEILMRQPEQDDDADNPLRLCYTGPAPDRERHLEIERRFGLRIVCGYAMSESPYGLIWPHGSRPYGTLGTVRQHPTLGAVNEGRVVAVRPPPDADENAGADVDADPGADADVADSVGELLLRNPTITPGYWGMPAETAAAITQDGWLHTGDLVSRDSNGVYTFVARQKEVVRRRGENLSPTEVEEAITAHPNVVECAVIGVPAELSEDEIKAFVVTEGAVELTELRGWTAARLSAFKVPRYWQRIPELPRTPTQRIAKHRLPAGHPADEYDAEAGRQEVQRPAPFRSGGTG